MQLLSGNDFIVSHKKGNISFASSLNIRDENSNEKENVFNDNQEQNGEQRSSVTFVFD